MSNPAAWFEVTGKDGAVLQRFSGGLYDGRVQDARDGSGYGAVRAVARGIVGGTDASATLSVGGHDPTADLAMAERLDGRTIVPPAETPRFGLTLRPFFPTPRCVAEGEAILEWALGAGRAGPHQLHAAIAACHSGAPTAATIDWRQVSLLYQELIRYQPSPVAEARAIAVAMRKGPRRASTSSTAPTPAAAALAAAPRRPRRPSCPPGPGRGRRERVPGRTPAGAAGHRAALHPKAHPPAAGELNTCQVKTESARRTT